MNSDVPIAWQGADLFPADAAFMARCRAEDVLMAGYPPAGLDSVTGHAAGLLGRRPAVRHVSMVTDDILALMAAAGFRLEEELLTYQTMEEAFDLARRLVRRGHRLVSMLPLPEGLCPDQDLVVPRPLWRQLNDKTRLGELAPSSVLAPRITLAMDDARRHRWKGPCWVKVANDEPTGAGHAVRFCASPSDWLVALDELQSLGRVERVLLEEHVPADRSWCAALRIGDDGVDYLGSAEQWFLTPGRQAGSLIDPEFLPGAMSVAEVLEIGVSAQRLGFRGLAGIDFAERPDGSAVVFDPNFRLNASTSMVVLYRQAVQRTGRTVSVWVHAASRRPFREVLPALREWVDHRHLVPTRLLDAAHLPVAQGVSFLTGFVMASDRAEAENLRSLFAEEFSA